MPSPPSAIIIRMDAASQVNPARAREDISEASPISTLLRRFFPFYCALAALVTFGYALYEPFQIDGDAVAYMDIGDCLRAHQWAGIVNGYWHPLYPALLAAGHALFHSTPANELHAYYMANFVIFLLGMLAVVCFTDAIVRLRDRGSREQGTGNRESAGAPRLASEPWDSRAMSFLLTKYPLRYLGLALVVIASQRELSLGKVRPDALLQALLLFALAALLAHLATGRLRYAALMGLALGCAYLTKSFAFVFALLSIAALVGFRWLWLKHKVARILTAALAALVCFAALAGQYIAALSHARGRFDFGDSGALNYAWYVAGTEKMHLQPYQTAQFGSAQVHLKHPEKELLHSPLVLSYAQLPYGTYPDWFDTAYWNEQIKPHFTLSGEISRGSRNCVLIVRYLFNHPEALILLALLLALGARFTLPWKPRPGLASNAFWLPPLALGVLIWGIYATVNTEERYVTVAYLAIILTLFAALRIPQSASSFWRSQNLSIGAFLAPIASALILLLALLATGESLRTVLEDRRDILVLGYSDGWYSPTMAQVAGSLRQLGVRPGDTIACTGWSACLDDPYYARLDGVRITTEIYAGVTPAYDFLAGLPNRDQAIAVVRGQGARVLVANFGHARVSDADPFFRNWRQLGDTTFYALPLR
jgi:4-amino-4-deoxy-L-arabinose transferase-like glycosyltransferase